MTLYVKVENDEPVKYPVSYEDIYKEILEPVGKSKLPVDAEFLETNGYFPVVPQNAPTIGPTTRLTMGLPLLVSGVYYENYIMTEMTEEEKNENFDAKAFEVRELRDAILKETVDRMNPVRWESMTTEEKNSWAVYRQALLDIPNQDGFPFDIEFPNQPA